MSGELHSSGLINMPGHEVLVPDVVRAENCHVWDAAGKRYLDLESGVWCANIGHCNAAVLTALCEQAGRVPHTGFCFASGVAEEAARAVLDLHGFADGRCVLLCSGSEAVEYSVRVARMVAPGPRFLALADSYFGAYGSAHRKGQDEWLLFDWLACGSCPKDVPCDASCERFASIVFDDLGGFLFEPGSSSGLVRFPPRKLVTALATEIHARGGLVLVNEVTTGMGRTAAWFGYQHYGLAPDMVAMGKGLGNGYPVSATALSSEIVRRLDGAVVPYGQSHQNDPLGAAVALRVIRFIQEHGLIGRARELSDVLLSGLRGIMERTGKLRAVRGRGLMAVVEVAKDPDGTKTREVLHELARRGYLLCRRSGSNVLRLDPALTMESADLEGFLKAFEAVLNDF